MAKAPAKYRVRLGEQAIEGFASFVSHKEHWSAIVDAAERVQAASSMIAFCRHVSDSLELDKDAVDDVLMAIRNLKQSQKSAGRTDKEVVSDVTSALSRLPTSSPWTDDVMQAWNESVEEISALLEQFDDDSSLMLSSKAQYLVFDRPLILRDFKIITDIRPIFDSAAERIREMVVIHTLRIRYEDSEGFKEQYIAVDSDDLESIQKVCARAAAKSLVAQRSLCDHEEWRTVEYPETQDG